MNGDNFEEVEERERETCRQFLDIFERENSPKAFLTDWR